MSRLSHFYCSYAYYNQEHQIVGIAVDIAKELSKQTGDPFQFKLYPINQLKHLEKSGGIDLNFADSPNWQPAEQAKNYLFSVPYLHVVEGMYVKSSHPELSKKNSVGQCQNLTDSYAKGWQVGIVRGYLYPELNAAFQQGFLLKKEISTDANLLKLLDLDYLDAVIMDTLLFRYQLAYTEAKATDYRLICTLSPAPLGFKVNKAHKNKLEEINIELNKMLAEGQISSIIDKYLGHLSL